MDQIAVRLQNLPSVLDPNFGSIQKFVGFTDRADGCGSEVLALQCHDVDATGTRWKSFRQHVRWNVLKDARQPAHKAVAPNRRKVVNRNATAQGCVMFHFHVPTEHHIVGRDHAIFDLAIVRDVRTGHEIAVAPNAGDPQILFGSAVDRDALTKDVAISDHNLRR